MLYVLLKLKLQSKSLEEIDDLLEEQEQIIQKNIIYQMNLLKRLRTNRKLISRSENLNFTLQKRPGIYRIDTQKCYTIDLKKEEREELKEFCQKIPFVFSTALFPKERIENENKEFYYGMMKSTRLFSMNMPEKNHRKIQKGNIRYISEKFLIHFSVTSLQKIFSLIFSKSRKYSSEKGMFLQRFS